MLVLEGYLSCQNFKTESVPWGTEGFVQRKDARLTIV